MIHWKCKSTSIYGDKECSGPPGMFRDPTKRGGIVHINGKPEYLKQGWEFIETIEVSDLTRSKNPSHPDYINPMTGQANVKWDEGKVEETVPAPAQPMPAKRKS